MLTKILSLCYTTVSIFIGTFLITLISLKILLSQTYAPAAGFIFIILTPIPLLASIFFAIIAYFVRNKALFNPNTKVFRQTIIATTLSLGTIILFALINFEGLILITVVIVTNVIRVVDFTDSFLIQIAGVVILLSLTFFPSLYLLYKDLKKLSSENKNISISLKYSTKEDRKENNALSKVTNSQVVVALKMIIYIIFACFVISLFV